MSSILKSEPLFNYFPCKFKNLSLTLAWILTAKLQYIKCLNDNEFLGYKDWRLPNELEVRSLSNSGIPSSERSNWLSTFGFYNFSSVYVQTWSSTVEDSYGYPIGIWVGGGHWDVTFQSGHAWPIRGGYFSD